MFEELKELAADKESGRIQEVAGEGLVASKLELAFEEFYRQKSTSGLDSDRCSDVTSEKSLHHLDQSIEEAQAIISSRSSGKYASRAKSICEEIVARELSDVSDFAVSPEKKDVGYKMSRTPA